MNQIKKEDIKQEVFDLYDDYAHNRVNRREFMQSYRYMLSVDLQFLLS